MICDQRFVRYATNALGPTFLTPKVRNGIHFLAKRLPDVAVCHILECPLWGPPGTVDYSIALLRGSGGKSLLHNAVDATDSKQMDQVRAVLEAADGPLRGARVMWLEFDIAVDGSATLPSFFVAPRDQPCPHADASQLAKALFQSLDTTVPPDIAPILSALPDGVFLRQAGVMTGRAATNGRAVRLVLDGVFPDQIVPLLTQIDWPGPLPRAQRYQDLIERVAPGRHCRVDLDVRQSLMPTLGIELPRSALGAPDRLIAALAESRLGTNPKLSALSHLMRRQRVGPSTARNRPLRLDFGLNHLKFGIGVDDSGRGLTKAYFSLVKTPDFAATSAAGES